MPTNHSIPPSLKVEISPWTRLHLGRAFFRIEARNMTGPPLLTRRCFSFEHLEHEPWTCLTNGHPGHPGHPRFRPSRPGNPLKQVRASLPFHKSGLWMRPNREKLMHAVTGCMKSRVIWAHATVQECPFGRGGRCGWVLSGFAVAFLAVAFLDFRLLPQFVCGCLP